MVDRFWNKDPYWFSNLDEKTKISLIADFNLSNLSPEQLQDRINKSKKVIKKRLR